MLDYLAQNWYLILALIFVIFLLSKGAISKRLSGYDEVDPLQATQLINHENAIVLDVREPKEWAEGHIPGARHVPLGQLDSQMVSLEKLKERPVITQCRSGMRSAAAAAALKKAGFAKVYNLKGGIMAWRNAGLPMERD